MKKETIVTAKTVEAAKEIGAAELGVSVDIVDIEVIEEPSKGFLGFGATDAKVKVSYELTRGELAREFLEKLFNNMKLDAKLDIEEKDEEINVKISGDNMALNMGNEIRIINSNGWLLKKYTSDNQIKNIVIGDSVAGVIYKNRIEIIKL